MESKTASEYTILSDVRSIVYVIEYVVEPTGDAQLEDCLEKLREMGAAYVVAVHAVAEDYEAASEIARSRSVQL